jgi:hypothetical protein
MSGNNTKIWMAHGGDQMNVESGGKVNMKTGSQVLANGTQASHQADLATGASNAQIATKVNSVLAALEGVGILATS